MAARSNVRVCGRSLAGNGVRTPPGAWISVSGEFCVPSRWVLCVGLITHPEESYRAHCVWVWSWSLDNEDTLVQYGLLHHGKYSYSVPLNYCLFIWMLSSALANNNNNNNNKRPYWRLHNTTESANVKVKNLFHGRNNITCSTNGMVWYDVSVNCNWVATRWQEIVNTEQLQHFIP